MAAGPLSDRLRPGEHLLRRGIHVVRFAAVLLHRRNHFVRPSTWLESTLTPHDEFRGFRFVAHQPASLRGAGYQSASAGQGRLGRGRIDILAAVKDDQLKFLRGLRAVREYTSEPVSDDAICEILEVGRWTSTGGNRQPTEVVVVRDKGVLQKFAEWGARPAGTSAVSLLLVSTSDRATFDEGRMAERLALAARAAGLGSVIATLKNEGPDQAKRLLGIPGERRAVALVAIGHIDVEARRALPKKGPDARKPLAEYTHWDRF